MELIHHDILQLGMARECIFLAKRKLRLLDSLPDLTTSEHKYAHMRGIAEASGRWEYVFANLLKSAVNKDEDNIRQSAFERVLKVFKHSMLCDQIGKQILCAKNAKLKLENFHLNDPISYLDTVTTGSPMD